MGRGTGCTGTIQATARGAGALSARRVEWLDISHRADSHWEKHPGDHTPDGRTGSESYADELEARAAEVGPEDVLYPIFLKIAAEDRLADGSHPMSRAAQAQIEGVLALHDAGDREVGKWPLYGLIMRLYKRRQLSLLSASELTGIPYHVILMRMRDMRAM